MKQIYLMGAILFLLAGCAQHDPEIDEVPDNTPRSLSIRVGVQAQPMTKSIIYGSSFTAPAEIGVHVAQGSKDDPTGNQGAIGNPYAPDAGNVKFTLIGDEWQPVTPVSLAAANGTVYAYYPFNPGVSFSAANPGIPVSVTTTGTITVKGGAEATGSVNKPGAILTPVTAETDYMYYDPTTNPSSIQSKAVVNNRNADASLIMHHAFAQVSFRLVKNGSYSNGGAEGQLTKYVLADNGSNHLIVTGGTMSMNISNGSVTTTNPVAGTITRNIQGYRLGNDPDAATIISNLVLPVSSFNNNDLKVTFTIDGVTYDAILPTTKIQYWNGGSNYLYTVTLSGTGLNVADVEIVDWNNMDGGEIDIQ